MQVVGYRTDAREDGPALLVAEEGRVRAEPLDPGTRLDYGLGVRRCAGAVDDGTHDPCDAAAAPYCPRHSSTWVCARCTGDCVKPESNCEETHAVYLAAFAPATFKVGVTKDYRIGTRLREQGADRAAHVHTVPDGRIARQMEADIADAVPDRVRVPEKLAGLHRTVDEDAWTALLDGFDVREEYAFDYGFDVDSRPVGATLARGAVRGTKGRLLVLDRGETTYGVDLRDLVGYELDPGRADADRQASLSGYL